MKVFLKDTKKNQAFSIYPKSIVFCHLKSSASKDSVISKILCYVTGGWPDKKEIEALVGYTSNYPARWQTKLLTGATHRSPRSFTAECPGS